MALSVSSLPSGFSWLRATYRPSAQEIDAYMEVIAKAEGRPWPIDDSHLHDEAELQLWIWRTETKKRAPRSPRREHEPAFQVASAHPADAFSAI